jgi:hypothetical protein
MGWYPSGCRQNLHLVPVFLADADDEHWYVGSEDNFTRPLTICDTNGGT